jgi:dipeptidyl aminopeptidase/acylaminoacyl peptidase
MRRTLARGGRAVRRSRLFLGFPPAGVSVVACLALVLLPRGAAAASYPPEYHFRTISTDAVSVHFHQGEEAMAREAAALATGLLAQHEARYGQKVPHVHIVLVDAEDDPNGFASPLPFPFVTIRAVAPNGTDAFGNHEGWLRLALTHELAHVVQLEESRGIWGVGRKIFGRAPFLFPNTLAMSWMIEGLATYEETELTAFGRGRDPDSLMVVRMAALEGSFPAEDRAIYALDAWPGGLTPYLFGEAFLRDLSERGGADTLPRLTRQHAVQFPPFLDGRAVGRATGTGLHTGWREWSRRLAESAEQQKAERSAVGLTVSRALTTRGIQQLGPRFSPDGARVAYTSGTLTRFPEIRLLAADGSGDRRLALRNGGSGLAWTPDGKQIVYAELQVHRRFSIFGDLSVVSVESGRVHRLTHGVRALDPDVSPDGRTIVFARKMGDRSELFTIGRDGRGLAPLTASVPGVEWSGPRFRPPWGDAIVAARLLPGGWLDVVLVDRATGTVEQLTHDRAKDVEPTWTPDGASVVFRSDRDGVSNLYALRLADRRLVRVTNVVGGAFQPSVSPDGRSVAYAEYSSRGYDVHVAPLETEAARAAPPYVDDHPAPRPDPVPAAGAVAPYRPWSMLLPRFWMPWVELGSSEDRVGAATGGSDALLRHAWGAQAAWGKNAERVNASGFYLYDRFRTTLLATGQDETDVSGDSLVRTRKVDLQAALPLVRTIRKVHTLSVTYRRERQEVLGSEDPQARLDLGGIQTAYTLASARSYPFSISPVDGARFQVAWLREAKALGSDLALDKLTLDARLYQRLFGERDVLALRAGFGTTWGEPEFERSFAVGGYPDASLLDIVRTNNAVLRGYPDNAFTGRRYAAANLEYRFPLFTPQRGWRSLPVFLRHFHGTLFFDAAHAWSGEFRLADVKTAAGASIGLDSAIGFALPLTVEVAVAHGFATLGETKAYFRFGLAF